MKFKSTPNHAIMNHNNEFWFKFDEEGIFDLDKHIEEYKIKMAEKLKIYFEEVDEVHETIEPKIITCNTCGETFDNRGKFMQHAKTHKS